MKSRFWFAAIAIGAAVGVGLDDFEASAAPLPPMLTDDAGASAVLDVRYRGGGGYVYRGGGHHRGGGGHHFRPGPRVLFYAAPPITYYGYSSYRGSYCISLRRKARETGSPYWWRRYHNEC